MIIQLKLRRTKTPIAFSIYNITIISSGREFDQAIVNGYEVSETYNRVMDLCAKAFKRLK